MSPVVEFSTNPAGRPVAEYSIESPSGSVADNWSENSWPSNSRNVPGSAKLGAEFAETVTGGEVTGSLSEPPIYYPERY